MAHLITLDEHPDTVALVLTLEEAAKIKMLVGNVVCSDSITTVWDQMHTNAEIMAEFERWVLCNKDGGSMTLEFKELT